MRAAIVNDWLANMGGAERVLLAVHEIYPDAPVYCTIANFDRLSPEVRSLDIRTSFLQRMPLSRRKYQSYLPLVPLAVEQFDLTGYDLVISLSFCAAKGVITRPGTTHVCYCHTPMRYAWDMFHDYRDRERLSSLTRLALAPVMNYLRVWDYVSSARVDYFAANSTTVARRLKKYYRRDCTVIPPPVDTSTFAPNGCKTSDYYLYVSRLVRYKRADLAVEAFNQLGKPLYVVGDGPQRKRLERRAQPNVKFLGRPSDQELARLYQGCRALVFPQEEDFGIVPLEAQACGKPVIAFGSGGALDTVRPGQTGVFFDQQTPQSLISALVEFENKKFDAETIRQHASSFGAARFKRDFAGFVEQKCREHESSMTLAGQQGSFHKRERVREQYDGAVDRYEPTRP